MNKRCLPALALAALLCGAHAEEAPRQARFDLVISSAPATQVFTQIASGSAYNMLLSPEVAGNVSLTLRNTTIFEALDSLRELYGYDYRVSGNRILVAPNTVQTRMFRINYLSGRRQGASDIRVSSSSITNTSTTGGTPGAAPITAAQPHGEDNASVHTTSDADFWREVRQSLIALVGAEGGRSVVLNPAAGVIVVRATPAELRQAAAYLEAVQINVERQVMLEAKIIEVDLNDDSQAGVNWAGFSNHFLGKNIGLTVGNAAPGATLGAHGTTGAITDGAGNSVNAGTALATSALGKGFYGLAFQAANFASMINFLQSHGNANVLSSPRIATLNNQKAVLKVGTDALFVTGVSTSQQITGNTTTSSPSLTLTPFFSGIALDVTPQIDGDGNVILHVHPSVSVVQEQTKQINLGSLGAFQLPLATSTINETDSVVRIKDGEIAAIGGLMQVSSSDSRDGVPGLQSVPVVGGLFRQTSTTRRKHELVILLKPTIIEDAQWPDHVADHRAAQEQAP
ncbi:MAG TPA: pilus (MSHA type) biogenesis protein MshL [Burkholderiaceae bacterium]|jgi:MSHA biogenesis protein MshL